MTEIIFSPAPRPARRLKESKPAKMRKPIPKVSAKVLAANGGKAPRKARKPVKARNDARRKREFARCYGSVERVEWIKAQPCMACGFRGATENAHIIGGGGSRKADARYIVPLCRTVVTWAKTHRGCHDHLHALGSPAAFRRVHGFDLRAAANAVAARWDALGSARGDEGER